MKGFCTFFLNLDLICLLRYSSLQCLYINLLHRELQHEYKTEENYFTVLRGISISLLHQQTVKHKSCKSIQQNNLRSGLNVCATYAFQNDCFGPVLVLLVIFMWPYSQSTSSSVVSSTMNQSLCSPCMLSWEWLRDSPQKAISWTKTKPNLHSTN